MRVVIDARYLDSPGSGVGTYTEHLVRGLLAADTDFEYDLVCRKPGLSERFGTDRCRDVPFDAPPRSIRTRYLLGRLLKRREWSVFHSPFNLLPDGLARPSVVTVHDVIPLMDPTLVDTRWSYRIGAARGWRMGLVRAIGQASAIVTISETSAREIVRHFGPEVEARTVVTGNGVDPFFLEPASDDASLAGRLAGGDRPYVLAVGQGSPRKNHPRALRAFARAFGPDDPMRFVLVRRIDRHDPELEKVLDEPTLRDRVVLLGPVSRVELRALYRNARAFFFPSLVEGFGLPILEAMASRCPVVTSDTGAMAEVAGDAAWLCPPRDVDAMAAALRSATTDGEERQRIVESGVRRAASYSFLRCARRTLDVYRSLADRPPASPSRPPILD